MNHNPKTIAEVHAFLKETTDEFDQSLSVWNKLFASVKPAYVAVLAVYTAHLTERVAELEKKLDPLSESKEKEV